jgi:hypothetical protein
MHLPGFDASTLLSGAYGTLALALDRVIDANRVSGGPIDRVLGATRGYEPARYGTLARVLGANRGYEPSRCGTLARVLGATCGYGRR